MSEDKVAALRTLPLLADADPADLERIAGRIEPKRFQPGEPLVQQGTMGSSVFFIAEGSCEVRRADHGREERRATLKAGDFFGEMAVLAPHPRTATVVALEPTLAYVLSAWEFREALHGSFKMTMQVMRMLADRLRGVEDELGRLKAEARPGSPARVKRPGKKRPARRRTARR